MSKAWRGVNSRAWRRVRAEVLAENQRVNQGKCRLAIRTVCTGQAEQVHHVLGRAATGDDRRYLMATCRACNLHVGDPASGTVPHRSVSRW